MKATLGSGHLTEEQKAEVVRFAREILKLSHQPYMESLAMWGRLPQFTRDYWYSKYRDLLGKEPEAEFTE